MHKEFWRENLKERDHLEGLWAYDAAVKTTVQQTGYGWRRLDSSGSW